MICKIGLMGCIVTRGGGIRLQSGVACSRMRWNGMAWCMGCGGVGGMRWIAKLTDEDVTGEHVVVEHVYF